MIETLTIENPHHCNMGAVSEILEGVGCWRPTGKLGAWNRGHDPKQSGDGVVNEILAQLASIRAGGVHFVVEVNGHTFRGGSPHQA